MKTNLNMNIRLTILAAAFTGSAALIYEIVATKALFYFFNESTHSVSAVVATFLMGLAVGAYLISRKISTIENKRNVFAGMQLGIGIYALFILPRFSLVPIVLEFIYGLFGSTPSLLLVSKFITSMIYLLIPTILIGASFPLICSMVIKSLEETGRKIGLVYFFDLLGAVTGSLLAGFVLLPRYGISATYFLGGILSFLAAFLVLFNGKKTVMIKAGAVAAIAMFGSFIITDPFQAETITVLEEKEGFAFEKHFEKKDVLFAQHSPFGEVRVVRDPEYENDLVLYINRREQCFGSISPSEEDVARTTLAGVEGDNLKVLNIGLGCGMTLNALAQDSRVAKIQVVEINPVVFEAAEYFSEYNDNVLRNKKLGGKGFINDGFRYLASSNEVYDAIVMDIENPSIVHSSPLYTAEFFQEVADALSQRGVFGLWAYKGGPEYLAVIYYSLRTAFQSVYLVQEEVFGEYFFISSNKKLDPDALGLKEADISRLEHLKRIKNYKLNTLNNPVLEYEFEWD